MDHYTISAYKHSSTLIKGIQGKGLNPALQQIVEAGSGAPDPTFVSVGQVQPEITFDTTAIKTALANIGGNAGAALNSDYFFFQKMAAGGLRAGASSHVKITAATGIIIPTTINASPGPTSVLGYRAILTSSDGTASPIAIAGSQSLDAGQGVIDEAYTLGAVTINGTELECVSNLILDFGLTLEIVNVHVYPTFVSIMDRIPSITVSTNDMSAFETWGLTGIAQDSNDSTIQLLDKVAGGARGTSPITFTIDAGMAFYENLSGRQGQRWAGSVRITPVSDGVADIIAITGIT